ncbi:MAG: DNA translocase FtsK [Chlamydiae bacterium]|nr:DNA translocase FtsK [Chlamydiota bacterium]
MKKKKALPPKEKKPLSPIFKGIFLLFATIFLALSLVSYHDGIPSDNWLGLLGHVLAWGVNYLFGLSSFLLIPFLGWLSWSLLTKRDLTNLPQKFLFFSLTLLSTSVLLAMLAQASPSPASLFERWIYNDYYPRKASYNPEALRHYLGGVPLHHLYIDTTLNLRKFLGTLGTLFVFSSILLVSGTMLTELPVKTVWRKTKTLFNTLFATLKPKFKLRPLPALALGNRNKPFEKEDQKDDVPSLARENPLKRETQVKLPSPKPTPQPAPSSTVTPGEMITPPKQHSLEEYSRPPSSLLTAVNHPDKSALTSDLKKQAEVLEETFLSFGIEAKVGDIHCGPTITSFEVHPAVGVKVQKIKALENDIALNMQAKSIRIIAPIPGKAAVGIEIPNSHPQEVSFRDMLESYQASNKKFHIPLLLGKMVNGDDVWTDLTKMPHLIIAGATGSGKSVCINTIVMSIVLNARPDEIKLLMVDPKKVELTAYTHLPHMLAPVITEPGGARSALDWLVKEMERRYEIFRLMGIRNVHTFNTRKIDREFEESLDVEIPEKLPYLVGIIDELADLMMVSSADIETPIARIAQMARAVGIHMILATQRPSREVITGLIKANFPCRIAFKVSSRVNSQIIIDENGAEILLGNGDMLFLPPGTSTLLRAQGAFIRDEDISKTIHYICSQAPTRYLIPSFDNYRGEDLLEEEDETDKDPLYEGAKSLVFETGNASTTFLQRKLKLGYARAASLMDQLEKRGVIGPSMGAKPRKIYYPEEES